jgi:hypothetical protein
VRGEHQQGQLPGIPAEVDVKPARDGEARDPAQERALRDIRASQPPVLTKDPGSSCAVIP